MYRLPLPKINKEDKEDIESIYKKELKIFKATHHLTREEKMKYPFFTYIKLFAEFSQQLALEQAVITSLEKANKPEEGFYDDDWLRVKRAFENCEKLVQLFPTSFLIAKYDLNKFVAEYAGSRHKDNPIRKALKNDCSEQGTKKGTKLAKP